MQLAVWLHFMAARHGVHTLTTSKSRRRTSWIALSDGWRSKPAESMWRRLALFWVIGVANALLNGAHLRPMTRGRQVPNPRNVVTWIYAGDSFLDRNFNINDDDDKNYDEDEDEGGDAEESIEALVENILWLIL